MTNHQYEAYDRDRKGGIPSVGSGMFAALSHDDGGNTRVYHSDASHAEPAGYLAATQTPDGTIDSICSG